MDSVHSILELTASDGKKYITTRMLPCLMHLQKSDFLSNFWSALHYGLFLFLQTIATIDSTDIQIL